VKVFRFITNYKTFISSWTVIEVIAAALGKLYPVLPPVNGVAFPVVLTQAGTQPGKYAPFADVLLSPLFAPFIGAVIPSVTASSVSTICIVIWFLEHSTVQKASFDDHDFL
jgi:hypothetical protein